MRPQMAGRLAACCLTFTLAPQVEADQSAGAPSAVARQFFDALPVRNAGAALMALRPTPMGLDERGRILAGLPEEGALEPDAGERGKLILLEPVLQYHQRHQVFQIKILDVPQAAIGLHARSVLLISRQALGLVSAARSSRTRSVTSSSGAITRAPASGATCARSRSWSSSAMGFRL